MIQNTSNYGKARQYYQKASHIDTRNAKPFNQLAILAWTAKRKFEAVYYHMRCLQTKSPVESSRQSLIEIFEDIRKRWEISEKKRLEERAQRKKEADSERDRMHLIKGNFFFLQKFDFTEKYFHLDIILYLLSFKERDCEKKFGYVPMEAEGCTVQPQLKKGLPIPRRQN